MAQTEAQPTTPTDASGKLSIIIPTRNETALIASTLAAAWSASNQEIIVVDGGSSDDTAEIARALGATVLSSPCGRGCQMNAGARAATGEMLLFLHADTLPPPQFDIYVRQILSQPGVAAGAFRLRIDAERTRSLAFIEAMANWRSAGRQLPYGDQGIFLRAKTFHELGGYPELPLMEDYEFIRRARALGRIVIAPASVFTSGRRWQRLGVWRTTLLNQFLILAYRLGVSPTRIADWYRCDRARDSE